MAINEHESIDVIAWFKALTLNERVQFFSILSPLSHTEKLNLFQTDLNQNLINQAQSWSISRQENQNQPIDTKYLNSIIRQENLPVPAFLNLLDTELKNKLFSHAELGNSLTRFEWLNSCYLDASDNQRLQQLLPDAPKLSLLKLFEPLICTVVKKLLSKYSSYSFISGWISQLLPGLLSKLANLANRTLVLELNVARQLGQLTGETPESRFDCFIEQLTTTVKRNAFLSEYPVLARQAATFCLQWENWISSVTEHTIRDFPDLKNHFNLQELLLDDIVLMPAGSDTHNQGKSVLIMKQRSDGKPLLLYKPRNLALDSSFAQFTDTINTLDIQQHGQDATPLKSPKVLSRETYGWAEFITTHPCAERSDIARYYQRAGQTLALTWFLNGTDFHHENLVAHGEYPVLVDLETLLHPTSFFDSEEDFTVASTGLLPSKTKLWMNQQIIDVGGLGKNEQQTAQQSTWLNTNTDEMALGQISAVIDASDNHLPTLDNTACTLADFYTDFITGFDRYISLLAQPEVKEQLSLFDGLFTRWVIRNTQHYSSLLNTLFHPDTLTNGLNVSKQLSVLHTPATNNDDLNHIIATQEEKQLIQGDIPFFSLHTSEPFFADIHGQPFPCSSITPALKQITQRHHRLLIDKQAMVVKQHWFINGSITTSLDKTFSAPLSDLIEQETSSTNLIERISSRLLNLGRSSHNNRQWHWFDVGMQDEHWQLQPAGAGYYDGLCGIATFLAKYAEFADNSDAWQAAVETWHQAQAIHQHIYEAANIHADLPLSGGMNGIGGAIYCATVLSTISQQNFVMPFVSILTEHYSTIKHHIQQDTLHDIVAGNAGTLQGICAAVAADYERLRLQPLIDLLVDQLLTCQVRQEEGSGWQQAIHHQPLCGLSHGNAGILLALSSALPFVSEIKQQQIIVAISNGLNYENACWDQHANNWRDNRDFAVDKPTPTIGYWCHGNAGIGLSRVQLLKNIQSARLANTDSLTAMIQQDIERSTDALIQQSLPAGHSLCHGITGNLLALQVCSIHTGNVAGLNKVRHELSRFKQAITSPDDLKGGTPVKVAQPGLMTGLSGITLGLMALEQQQHPDFLLMTNSPH